MELSSSDVVPVVGLEPTRGISPTDFESVTSTITSHRHESGTRAYLTTGVCRLQAIKNETPLSLLSIQKIRDKQA